MSAKLIAQNTESIYARHKKCLKVPVAKQEDARRMQSEVKQTDGFAGDHARND